jgi:hypothetical protein
MINVTIIPTFWQRIKFLFCKRMIISGQPNSIKESMDVEFEGSLL